MKSSYSGIIDKYKIQYSRSQHTNRADVHGESESMTGIILKFCTLPHILLE